jgi:CarboxypepD_reg-like domain
VKHVALFILGFLLTATLFANGTGPAVMFVSGTVTDAQTQETLAGAKVCVKGTSIVTYTDFDGRFFLPDLPAASYTLEISCVSYKGETVIADTPDHRPEVSVSLEAR